MQVSERMTRNVKLIEAGATVRQAARTMRDEDFGSLPVGENDRLVGMITDRDIVVRGVAEDKNPDKTEVREVMSSGILYCFEDQDVEEVVMNMADNQVRRLPVLNRQKRLVGILSLGDIALTEEQTIQEEVGEALHQISQPKDGSAHPH